jgi:cell division protein FtsB
MQDTNHLFYLALALAGIILALLAMFFNYNLKLDKRTLTLEKKNGAEQAQIDKLKEEIAKLELEVKQLREAYDSSQKKLQKYEQK